ncbi:MAG: DNA-processing protein DprA [Bacteroidota bacterium]
MTKEMLLYVLALQHVDKVGDVIAKKLILQCGSAEAVFKEKKRHLLKIAGVGKTIVDNLRAPKHLLAAEKELEFIEQQGIAYSYFLDEYYPEHLKQCMDAPILLFSRGAIDLHDRKIISIVGTRQVTAYGVAFCEQLVADLAPLNPIIVSGFAYGTDIAAHRAALRHNLQTVGCLAHGLNQIYPQHHKKYVPHIEKNGGFLTDFWSTSHPERENFLKRNRIIAGISEATVVIESARKGGSLVTAAFANSYRREVFAVPGRITDTYSMGCNSLIQGQKAHLLTSAADLISVLGWEAKAKKPKSIQRQLFVSLTSEEQKIYDFLGQHDKALLDSIALHCDLPVYKVARLLLAMELKGILRPLPGKWFELM